MYTVGDNTVHVVDIGHETCKGGYAGSEQPCVFEKREGRSYEESLTGVLTYITEDTQDIPLINIEDPFMGKDARKQTFIHLIEGSMCSGALFINGAVTDCFSYGKSTGLLVRLCGGSTQVIPVVDGYCVTGGLKSSRGGEEITKFTREILKKKSKELGTDLLLPPVAIEEKRRVALEQLPEYREKSSYKTLTEDKKYPYEMEVARNFKESVSFVGHCQPKYYEFATGFATRIFSERNEIADRVFSSEGAVIERLDPHKQMPGAVEEMGLLEMVKAVLESVDLEYYDMLLGNVMLTGGGSLMPGIAEHLQGEMMKMYPNSRVKVAADKREFSTFFGGSILGSLSATSTLMITKADYLECGISALERKRSEWVR